MKAGMVVLGLALAAVSLTAAANISGAIFTTDVTGATVNMNIYAAKTDVYLNGGPQNDRSAGLPDGTYYFQVTNPSGSLLLSSDDVSCRQLQVTNGVVSGATGLCPHPNGNFNPANGSTGVQLAPFDTTDNAGGEYKAWLSPDPSFPSNNSKTDNFKVVEDNVVDLTISGEKYYDANANGQLDPDEVGIQGWHIYLSGDSASNTTSVFTSTTGAYSFNVGDGTYSVCEVMPAGPTQWHNTGPTTLSGIVVPPSAENENFGNVCVGAGNGFTLGFWSNPNGKTILGAHDPAWRNLLTALNLRKANGLAFDVAATGGFSTVYGGFRTWILSATATNMAYMLSAQLATMELNVAYGGNVGGPVPAGAIVYAGSAPAGCTVPGLGAYGFISIGALMSAANTGSNHSLAVDAVTVATSAARACQEFMKTTLDKANNNLNFVQAGPAQCPVDYTGNEPSCAP